MRKLLLLLLIPFISGCNKEEIIYDSCNEDSIEYLSIQQQIYVEFKDNKFDNQLVEFELRKYYDQKNYSVKYYKSVVNNSVAELNISAIYDFKGDKSINDNLLTLTRVGNFNSYSTLSVVLEPNYYVYLNLECYPKDLFIKNGLSVPDYATNSCIKTIN